MFTQKLSSRLGVTLVVVAGSLVAAPSASGDTSDVRESIRGADQALAQVETLVASNESATAAVKMARANALTRRADKQAEKVEGAKRNRAERAVARQYGENANVAIDSLDEVPSSAQVGFAELVDQALRGRERATATLTALLERLPEQAKVGIAKALVAIGASGAEQLAEIGEMVAAGGLAPDAVEVLGEVSGRLQSALDRMTSTLQGVIDALSPQAQASVQAGLDQVTAALTQVVSELEGLFPGLPIGGATGGPFG